MSKNTQKEHNNHSQGHPDHLHSHPFAAFFECCLGDQPAELSEKIQELRKKSPFNAESIEEIQLKPGESLTITKDMIIGDVLLNFPQTRPLLEDLHPLGLMSPLLDQITIEMFFSDQKVDPEEICRQLTALIAQTE